MTTSSAALIAALLGIALNNYSAEATVSEPAGTPAAVPTGTMPSPRPQAVPTAAPAREQAQPLTRPMAPLRSGDRFV